MTEIFAGVARILRGDLDAYWIHSLWIIQVLIGQVQSWWSLWSFRGVSDWNFAGLLFLLAPPTFYFLAAALLFPKSTEPGDLRAYYFQRSRPFFLVLACLTALYLAASWFTVGFDAGRVVSRVVGILLRGTLAFVRSPKIHAILSISGLIALALFIFGFTPSLASLHGQPG
jgi:hypothetical protein